MTLVSATDLAAFLRKAGLAADASDPVIEGFCAMAVEEFERLTGWVPFLATGAESSLTVGAEPGSRSVDLSTGFLSVSKVEAVGADGSAEEVGAGLWRPWPAGAVEQGWAYTHVAFVEAAPALVRVTGVRGRMDERHRSLPAVKAAVLAGAASLAYLYASQKPGTVSKVRQGSVEVAYGQGAGTALGDWRSSFDRAVSAYRRVVA